MRAARTLTGRTGFLGPAYLALLIVIFLLPSFSVDEYSIIKHTTSQLAAQHRPWAWVMGTAFALLGAASVLDGWPRLSGLPLLRGVLLFFGLSLIITAMFQEVPIEGGIQFSRAEDLLHSVFASLTGVSFTVFVVAVSFVETTRLRKAIALTVAVTVVPLAMLIFAIEEFAGMWQRMMFSIAFLWLAWLFQRPDATMSITADGKSGNLP